MFACCASLIYLCLLLCGLYFFFVWAFYRNGQLLLNVAHMWFVASGWRRSGHVGWVLLQLQKYSAKNGLVVPILPNHERQYDIIKQKKQQENSRNKSRLFIPRKKQAEYWHLWNRCMSKRRSAISHYMLLHNSRMFNRKEMFRFSSAYLLKKLCFVRILLSLFRLF